MRLVSLKSFILLAAVIAVGSSVSLVYVTDIPSYSSLAPCAAEAISQLVQGLTYSECPTAGVTALQTCACSQDQNSASISKTLSSQALESCGSTASEHAASVSYVFSAYCNQASPPPSPAPPAHPVTNYITELPAYSNLGPCAHEALSDVVQGFTYSICPSGANALASCACTKNENALYASDRIKTEVFNSCGSTHSEDVASAQAVFAGYCALGNGTSSFASPSPLSGHVTYYITDLPAYSSLALCAQEAVSNPVLMQTYYDCPSNPLQLVSCICVKDSNSQYISSQILTQVKNSCGSSSSSEISSALAVLDYYCSAGNGLVTPQGVTASATTIPYGSGGSGSGGGGGGGGSGATASNPYYSTSSPTETGSGGGPNLASIGVGASNKPPSTAAIAGGAVGGAVFICFILFVGWKLRRQGQKRQAQPTVEFSPNDPNQTEFSKAELPSTEAAIARDSKSPVQRKPIPSVTQTPVSPLDEKKESFLDGRPIGTHPVSPASPPPATLATPGDPNAQELHHDQAYQEAPGSPRQGVQHTGPYTEVPAGPNAQELPHDRPRAELGGMSANLQGPWYELDGGRPYGA